MQNNRLISELGVGGCGGVKMNVSSLMLGIREICLIFPRLLLDLLLSFSSCSRKKQGIYLCYCRSWL